MKYRIIVFAALLTPLSASAQVVIPGGLSPGQFSISGAAATGGGGGGSTGTLDFSNANNSALVAVIAGVL